MSSTDGTPSDIQPCLFYDNAPAAIEWICQAFGFTKRLVVTGDQGRVEHSELSLGTGVIFVASTTPSEKHFGPRNLTGVSASLSVYVADPDAHYERAVAARAKIIFPPRDEEYGARIYAVEDIEGHQWCFSNYRPGGYWSEAASVAEYANSECRNEQ